VRLRIRGLDQPGGGRDVHQLDGDLTVLADGRLVLLTPEEEVVDLGDALAALVAEEPDALGDRHMVAYAWCSRCSTATRG
jgi:hypothetical protein